MKFGIVKAPLEQAAEKLAVIFLRGGSKSQPQGLSHASKRTQRLLEAAVLHYDIACQR